MKVLVAVLFSVLATAYAAPRISTELTSSSEEDISDSFLTYYSDGFDEYVHIFLKVTDQERCKWNDTNLQIPYKGVTELDQGDPESETARSLMKAKILKVFDAMVEAIDDCLSAEDANITEYTAKEFASAYGQICDDTGEIILELFNPCIADADHLESQCVHEIAKKSSRSPIEDSEKSSKQKVCRAYFKFDLGTCVEEAVKETCKLKIPRSLS